MNGTVSKSSFFCTIPDYGSYICPAPNPADVLPHFVPEQCASPCVDLVPASKPLMSTTCPLTYKLELMLYEGLGAGAADCAKAVSFPDPLSKIKIAFTVPRFVVTLTVLAVGLAAVAAYVWHSKRTTVKPAALPDASSA